MFNSSRLTKRHIQNVVFYRNYMSGAPIFVHMSLPAILKDTKELKLDFSQVVQIIAVTNVIILLSRHPSTTAELRDLITIFMIFVYKRPLRFELNCKDV